jgi:plasmid stabilization system protein ParE
MNIIVLPQAGDEFEEAAASYNEKKPGLGERFRDEVDRHIRWIARHAEIPRPRPGGYRRVNLKVFPHYIAYMRFREALWILAIAHAHREPEYWIGRKQALDQPGASPKSGPRESA